MIYFSKNNQRDLWTNLLMPFRNCSNIIQIQEIFSILKQLLKKWSASPHQEMKIDEVVADIIEKVKKEIGILYTFIL